MTDRVYHLFIGRKFTGISVEPDPVWPKMWRVRQREWLSVRQREWLSVMLNETRAREAAFALARRMRNPAGGLGTVRPRWICRELDCSDVPIEFEGWVARAVAAGRQNASARRCTPSA